MGRSLGSAGETICDTYRFLRSPRRANCVYRQNRPTKELLDQGSQCEVTPKNPLGTNIRLGPEMTKVKGNEDEEWNRRYSTSVLKGPGREGGREGGEGKGPARERWEATVYR